MNKPAPTTPAAGLRSSSRETVSTRPATVAPVPTRPAARTEKRRTVRYPNRKPASCRLTRATGEGPWLAWLRDLSADGVGLMSAQPFKPRMLLTIELPGQKAVVGSPKQACVRHVEQLPGTQWWFVGCVFASRLSGDQLRAILG
jgi:hypothetical protein